MKYLVLDQGIYVEVSNGLSNGGKNSVIYTTNWEKSNPSHSEYAPGVNFEYLIKEKNFFKWVEGSDCIVNFDVFENDCIEFLRKQYPNKSIFGAGSGEILEHDRWKFKQLCKELGLPQNKSYRIIGIKKLREFLKSNPDKYIKTNIFRSDVESFYAKDYDFVEQRINGLQVKFGSLSDTIEFIAEEPINTDVEIGFDGFFNGNDYINECFLGYEYHKEFYLGKQYKFNELPSFIKDTMTKIKPTLQKMDYRGALSTEEKIVSKEKHYLIDWCSRLLSPASVGYTEWIKNWPELVYKIGKKDKVSLDCPYKYVSAIFLESDLAKEECVFLNIKDRERVKVMSACQMNDKYYAVKGCKTVVIPIGHGNTWQEAIEDLK